MNIGNQTLGQNRSETISWGKRFAATLATVALLLTTGGAAAQADEVEDGLWYYTDFHVETIHHSDITGKGVTIAILDSQINPNVPTLQGADIEIQSSLCYDNVGILIPPTSTTMEASHGTNTTSLIVGSGKGYHGQQGVKGVAPDVKILYFMALPQDENGTVECYGKNGIKYDGDVTADYIDLAVAKGADIISISLNVSFELELRDAIANALHNKVVIVSGLPNPLDLSKPVPLLDTWPATANGVVAVQRMNPNGSVPDGDTTYYYPMTTVAGPGGNILVQGSDNTRLWETQSIGSGTSYATPVVAGFLALVKQKYPKATGNQLIQSLVRGTDNGSHEPKLNSDSGSGYGVVSAVNMLGNDPTQYPDVNPLIRNDSDLGPSPEQIADGTRLTYSPEDVNKNNSPAMVVPVIIGFFVIFFIIIGLIVIISMFVSRRNSNNQSPQQGYYPPQQQPPYQQGNNNNYSQQQQHQQQQDYDNRNYRQQPPQQGQVPLPPPYGDNSNPSQ